MNKLPPEVDLRARIEQLRKRAAWHAAESCNFLRHSVAAMRQHELEAHELTATADYIEKSLNLTKDQK